MVIEFVIGLFIVLIGLGLTGYFYKRKHFREMDRLETRKMELMNRPVLAELSKVKQLNMNGEAEELFEKWRSTWDDIVATELPQIEEMLFETEDHIEKFRFGTARQEQERIATILHTSEETIHSMLQELEQLLGSEEKNREDLDASKEKYGELKRKLLTNRLAYGEAESKLEEQLGEIGTRFLEIEEATGNGDYLKARDMVLLIMEELCQVEKKLEMIPQLLNQCKTKIPNELKALRDGHEEMRQKGYELAHMNLIEEIRLVEKKLSSYIDRLHDGEWEDVSTEISQDEETINGYYEWLESEVHARLHNTEQLPKTEEKLAYMKNAQSSLDDDREYVSQSYEVDEEELRQHKKLQLSLQAVSDRLQDVKEKVEEEDIAQSFIKEEIERIQSTLEELHQTQEELSEKLQTLRKDELRAREVLSGLRKQIHATHRKLSKSNLPGLPETFQQHMYETNTVLSETQSYLAAKPLKMTLVLASLEDAEEKVQQLSTQTDELVEHVVLAEAVIQYGNRYRNQSSQVREKLHSAESSFRSFHYERALEEAATAVESVEPGALRKIEEWVAVKG